MRIPFWQSEKAHPTKAIDRLQSGRSFRRMMGISVGENFASIVGTLMVVRGTGKYARFKELDSVEIEFEESAQQVFRDLVANDSPSEADIQFASTELASYQSNCCKSLLNRSGVNKNELVALGVWDPGFWNVDFEGRKRFRSISNATELANQTSITVIDRFRERDLADGGNGSELFALAYWFLFADRDPKIAEENRLLILRTDSHFVTYFLPASDGLDSLLPAIECSDYSYEDFSEDSMIEAAVQRCLEIDDSLRLRLVVQDETVWPANDETIDCTPFADFGYSKNSLDAVATAFLANAFVDQLPVSIPGLTGNLSPRILGSLTPGSLVNFRNFVLETSKVSPSIMKLRDAV